MAGYIGSQTPVVSNGSQRKYTFTATAAQTVFTGMDIPNPQQIQVFQNGVRLVITTDYTVSSGTTVTLVNAASAGDSLVVILFADYQLLDTDALTFTGGTTIEGDLTVDTNTLYVDSTNNRVGVGTASPAFGSGSGLEIEQSDTATLRVERTGSTASAGEFFAGNDKVVIGSTSNTHLQFRTNGSEVGRFLSGGGLTFNGDTAAANALSDYEEGTWTPSITGSSGYSGQSYSVQQGDYTKIGNQVICRFGITFSAKGTFSGYLQLSGFPFTIENTPATVHLGTCYFVDVGQNIISLGLQGYENNSAAYLWIKTTANTAREYPNAASFINNTTQITGSFTFQTTS